MPGHSIARQYRSCIDLHFFLSLPLCKSNQYNYVIVLNFFNANHNSCRLLCHLLVILKFIFANSVDPDQTARVHTICLYAKIDLKSLDEFSADDINRRHFQMQGFLGILRILTLRYVNVQQGSN